MDIDVNYEVEGGTASIQGTLSKEDVEFAVKYGLLHMIQNGVLVPTPPAQPEVVVIGENDGSVN